MYAVRAQQMQPECKIEAIEPKQSPKNRWYNEKREKVSFLGRKKNQ